MKATQQILFVVGALGCATAGALAAACASDGSVLPDTEDEVVVPVNDATSAETGNAEAGACTTDDCEFFPAVCGPDVLCPNGPFDPVDPTVGMDWRTRVTVIRGRSASDVWVAGTVGTVAHFDGTSWTPSDVGTQEVLSVLWLAGAGEITFGAIKRIYTRGLAVDAGVSAGGWSLRAAPAAPAGSGSELTAAWAMPGSNALWVATDTNLWRLQLTAGGAFESRPGIPSSVCAVIPCRRMRSIHGASAGTVWAVGDVGASVRITGADGDTPEATPLDTLTWTGLPGVWAAEGTDVWAVGGSGPFRRYTGSPLGWEVTSGVPTTEHLNAVYGTSSSDVWVVGNAGVVLHYDGASWSRVKIAGLGDRRPDLYAVWSPGPGHILIGGQGIVLALGGKP